MDWSAISAFLLALAVGLGAFGAHGLRGRLDASQLDIYKTGVLYHFLHALGMLIVSALPRAGKCSAEAAGQVCWLLFAGILLFSGSLYLLAITGTSILGVVTPFGGVAFLLAWLLLAWRLTQR